MNNTPLTSNIQLLLKYKQYALYTKAIREILILKNEGYPLNRNSSLNKGMKKIETLQDRIIEQKIQENLHGNTKPINHTQTTNNIIEDTLTHQRKSLIRKDNGNADKITRGNIEQYQRILANRVTKEQNKLDNRIEEEIRKAQKQRLKNKEIEEQVRKTLTENKPRIKHILRDATHTNKCGISFAGALEQGYKYKVWNNGRSRTRVRPWHLAKNIQAVGMDDVFEIFGSFQAFMMYPGDLNGGAENVANCRCWLSYTNEKPANLKEYTSVSVGSTYKPSVNVPFGGLNITSKTKPKKSSVSYKASKGKPSLTSRIKNQVNKIIKPVQTTLKKIPKEIKQIFSNKNFHNHFLNFHSVNSVKGKYHVDLDKIHNNYNKDLEILKKDGNLLIEENIKIDLEIEGVTNLSQEEKFTKIYFKDTGFTYYISKNESLIEVLDIHKFQNILPEKLRVKDVVISTQKPIDNGVLVKGDVNSKYNDRIYIFDGLYETIIHESVHIWDGPGVFNISNGNYKNLFHNDLTALKNDPLEKVHFISSYSEDFYRKGNINIGKEGVKSKYYNRLYSEDLAEFIRVMLKTPVKAKKFKNKFSFVKNELNLSDKDLEILVERLDL